MSRIVLFAGAWGPRAGGINAFNADLCIAMRKVSSDETEIVCVVIGDATEGERNAWRQEADGHGIRLEFLEGVLEKKTPSEQHITTLQRLDTAAILYVGHDLFTGDWAVNAGRILKRPSMVICHMAPNRYKAYQKRLGNDIDRVVEKQQALFGSATYIGGVGPRLLEHAKTLLPDKRADEFVPLTPGLAEIKPGKYGNTAFSGITIGRITPEDDMLKQGSLAISAFGTAANQLAESMQSLDVIFKAIGLSSEEKKYRSECKKLCKLINDRANRAVHFTGISFNEDRQQLFKQIRGQDVFYFLSLHDGFGLAGFEAIAAGVPLVMTNRCGLYDFLVENKLEHMVHVVSLDGPDHDSGSRDMKQVVDKTIGIFQERTEMHARARALREQLKTLDISWERCARQLLNGCKLDPSPLFDDSIPAARCFARPLKQWPWSGLNDEEERAAREFLAWLLRGVDTLAIVEGDMSSNKRRVVQRMIDLVNWDLKSLLRFHIERIEESTMSAANEKIRELLAAHSNSNEKAEGNQSLLIVLRPPSDGDEPFWSTLIESLRSSGSIALVTENPKDTIDSLNTCPRIAWRVENATEFGFSANSDPLVIEIDDAAISAIASTRFGLSSDELFQTLDAFTEEQRYSLIARLGNEAVDSIVRADNRWRYVDNDLQEAHTVFSNVIVDNLRPAVDLAIDSARQCRWEKLRLLLPSALEGIAQIACAGNANGALTLLETKIIDETIYRYARFDWALLVMRAFFIDQDFKNCRLKEPEAAARCLSRAAQALTNLGRVNEATVLYNRAIDIIDTPFPALQLGAAMCRYLSGEYASAEALLAASLNGEGVKRGAIHRSRGKIYLRTLELEKSYEALEIARDAYRVSEDEQGLSGVDAYSADIAIARGDTSEALRLVDDGLDRLSRLEKQPSSRSDARDRVRLLLAKTKALLAEGRSEAAQAASREALTAAVLTGAIDFIIDAHMAAAVSCGSSADSCAQIASLRHLAQKAECYGLKRHHAELLLTIGKLQYRMGNIEAARSSAEKTKSISVLGGGTYQDAWLQREAGAFLETLHGL